MPNLFIIGNGFDLAHNMKTGYQHFRKYLLENYNIHNNWFIRVPESVLDQHGEEQQNDDEVVELLFYLLDSAAPINPRTGEIRWNSFENLLGKMNLSECFATVEKQYDREGDRNYSWEHAVAESICSDMNLAVPRISEFFSRWIQTIEVSDVPKPRFQKLIDEHNDLFLSFNYTKTLEKLYHCDESSVCHIHGVVSDDEYCISPDLILGHSGKMDYVNDESVPYEMGAGLQHLYETLRKDTARQIKLHHSFFERIKNTPIERIYSFGFSFSEVDKPYIREICKCLDSAKTVWLLHSYDESEKRKRFQQTIRECGFLGELSCFDA